MDFSFQVIAHNLPYLLLAARWTLMISLAGMAIGLGLGILVCAARLSRHAWLSSLAALYISFFRGVPLLVQLLAFFYSVGKWFFYKNMLREFNGLYCTFIMRKSWGYYINHITSFN